MSAPLLDPTGEALSTLVELVKLYSPSGEEGRAVDYLVGRMNALGFEKAYRDPAGNAVGIKGDGPRALALLGHIDTVPGEIRVHIEGDELYGRGTVDAKGPLAAFVTAAARVDPPPGWQVIVIGALDEEGDSRGARFAAGQFTPQFALIGEPSRWDRITLGYKGSAYAELLLKRPLAHSAGQAQSAPEAAFSAWEKILSWTEAYNSGRERQFERLTPSLRGIASGEDGFEGWASLQVGARLPPGLPPEDWYACLETLCPGEELRRTGFSLPAWRGEKNTPLVRALLAGIREEGGTPGFVLKTGTADVNLVAPAWGCPAAAYGPGDSALDHTPEERISLSEYLRSVAVLQRVLEKLLQ